MIDAGAEFSPCRKYRYKLWRIWDETKLRLYFILMNPSTADEINNDPTIERQCRRAEQLGYGGVVILNCGAVRETDSKRAWSMSDPIGPDNLRIIREEVEGFPEARFIAGWGRPARRFGADEPILDIFRRLERPLHCLGINSDGSPKHPLYVKYSQELIDYGG